MRRAFIAVAAALVFGALAVSTASAHALLTSADPAPNSVQKAAPAVVTLMFTETPDPKLSSVRVLDSDGRPVTTASVSSVAGQADELSVAIGRLPDGVFTVAWRTVSAVDGHIAAGSYAFSIGTTPPPAGATTAAPTASEAESGTSTRVVVARWILFVGLLGLLGAAFLGSVLLPGEFRLPLRLALVEAGVALAGTVLLIGFQIGDAGASVADLPGTSLGNDAVWRLAPLLIATALLVAAFRLSVRARRALLAATGVLAAMALLVEATLSHAATQASAPAEIGLQWLHLAAVGLWLGGLIALLAELRGPATPAKGELARRFAALAGLGLGMVAVTGLLRSIVDIGTLDALVSTDFGRLVLLKVGLLAPIAALGALNHFRNVPRANHELGPLRRSGSIELVLGALVLLVASLLVNVAPPTEVAAAAAGSSAPAAPAASATLAPLLVTGSDFGTTIRLALTVSPGIVGSNDFSARVTDYDSGVLVDATAVRLSFSLPVRPDVGSSTLQLSRQTSGAFAGIGANLSMSGTWLVSALVTEPTTSVQVDLQVTAQSAPQQIDVNRVPGLPTIYTVHLGSGRTVQVYLDPGTPGPNTLHATWFDASGKEMPVSNVTMTEILTTGGSLALQPQILDSGHEAAPVQVASLPATFALNATGPGGIALQTQLQIAQSS
jgi:copper transport protein